RYPIRAILPLSAHATIGDAAAAPPSRVDMNSRRRMWIATRPSKPARQGCYHALIGAVVTPRRLKSRDQFAPFRNSRNIGCIDRPWTPLARCNSDSGKHRQTGEVQCPKSEYDN